MNAVILPLVTEILIGWDGDSSAAPKTGEAATAATGGTMGVGLGEVLGDVLVGIGLDPEVAVSDPEIGGTETELIELEPDPLVVGPTVEFTVATVVPPFGACDVQPATSGTSTASTASSRRRRVGVVDR